MYWLSYVVIAVILGGLIVAYKTEMYLTQVLIIQNLVIFMIVFIPSFRYPSLINNVYSDLAGRAIYLQTGERLYTFVTLMFLHASFLHIAGNILILFFIGVALEDRIGKKWTAVSFFVTGLIATLGQYFVIWGSVGLNLGASGAIMGLMGTIVILYPKDKIPMILGFIFMPEVRVDLAVVVFLTMQTGIALLNPYSNIAHAAHFSGFAAGMLLALVIKRVSAVERREVRDHSKLKKLVTTEELQEIYKKIKEAENTDVEDAWVEHFLEKAQCPRCQRRLKGEECECGYNVWED